MPARRIAAVPAVLALLGSVTGACFSPAAAGLQLDRMPLDAARYCNRSCPSASCSVVCRIPDDCASACTRRGAPVCRCRHGQQT